MNFRTTEDFIKASENYIKAFFKKHDCRGVYTECLFEDAARRGLYVPGTYGSPFSQALANVTEVEAIHDDNGEYIYSIFKLRAGA